MALSSSECILVCVRRIVSVAGVAALVLAGPRASAQTNESIQSPTELKKLSLEELTEIDVTTASRHVERLSQTAAAVTVSPGRIRLIKGPAPRIVWRNFRIVPKQF